LCLLIVTITTATAETNQTEYINIIAWWGYLNYPWVQPYIRKKCSANISVDQYYSNREFTDLFKSKSSNYDIVISQSPGYNEIRHLVPSIEGSTVHLNSENYNKIIEKHYRQEHFPHNVAYFFQSVTGVLWNDRIIVNQKNLPFPDILHGVSERLITSLDDPIYLSTLISNNKIGDGNLNYDSYKKLFGNNIVILANSFYKKIYDHKDFALSYTWSGEAIYDIQHSLNTSRSHLHFSVNPSYSFIASDIVAAMNENKKTECVANLLASKKFMDKLQNNTYYFTPFVDPKNVKNKIFLSNYKLYADELDKLKWIPTPLPKTKKHLDQEWAYITMKTREKLKQAQSKNHI